MISIDSESTGLDWYFGARPFFITTCKQDGSQLYWEWRVNPLTREPEIPEDDIKEIKQLIDDEIAKPDGCLVLQNAKFDVTALSFIGIKWEDRHWEKVFDTLVAGHLLASNRPHDLTSMALQYLGIDIEPLEKKLEVVVKAARNYARKHHPDWRIAKKGLEDMPSAKDKTWKLDMWLPREIALADNFDEDHEWLTVLRDYSNADSGATIGIWLKQRDEIVRRGLWEIFLTRMKVIPVALGMESRGVTVSGNRLNELMEIYKEESERSGRVCVNIAKSCGYDLKMPKNGVNTSLRNFMFDVLNVEQVKPKGKKAKTAKPTLDKNTMAYYSTTLPHNSKPLAFVKALLKKRSRDTSVAFMEGYKRFWRQLEEEGWYLLHPNLNITGTDTLRWSSSNPNSQNVRSDEEEKESLRYAFGPKPGREWWSLDYENIELRIPAYVANERMMIELFEKPNDPPYFGSYHLMNASIIYPDLFWPIADKKGEFKTKHKNWYKLCKNFGFAFQYSGGEETCDRAAHRKGSYKAVKEKLTGLTKLNQACVNKANKYGYVEILPDRTVNPKRGYPLLCTRSEFGKVMTTVPLNFFIQGGACWAAMKSMIRCEEQLKQWRSEGFDGFMTMYIHDENVFDFPKSKTDPIEELKQNNGKIPLFRTSNSSNLWRIKRIKELMEMSGEVDFGIPLKVSVTYNPDNWSSGESVNL